jgi:hypothetical protein
MSTEYVPHTKSSNGMDFGQEFLPDLKPRELVAHVDFMAPMAHMVLNDNPVSDAQPCLNAGSFLVIPGTAMDSLLKPLPDLSAVFPESKEWGKPIVVSTMRGGILISHHLDVTTMFADATVSQHRHRQLRSIFARQGLALYDYTLKTYPIAGLQKVILELRLKSRMLEQHVMNWVRSQGLIENHEDIYELVAKHWMKALTDEEVNCTPNLGRNGWNDSESGAEDDGGEESQECTANVLQE